MPIAPESAERFRAALHVLTGAEPTPGCRLGIAVSGGADSLALLLLADSAFPGAIAAATVDHGLRPAAADEARFVGEVCAGLGVPHATLAGQAGPGRGTQDKARQLRYALLSDWAAEAGIDWIATAHHADDQAETLLMRLARGSGLSGLSGVRGVGRSAARGPVRIVRPLLGWRRAELAGIVAARGLTPVDDPSNRDERYDRTRFRALLAATHLLDPARLATAAAHLGDAEAAIAWSIEALWRERVTLAGDGTATIDAAGLPREYRRRLLARAIDRLSKAAGESRPYRGDALDRLIGRLDRGESGMLLDFLVRPGPLWHIMPAPPRTNR